MNRRIDIQDFAIYAVLTDTKQWEFLAYDGAQQKFYRDEPISLSGRPLEDHWLYIRSMVQGKLLSYLNFRADCKWSTVCNRIFGILLQGYINTLKAYSTKSFRRGEAGDVSIVKIQPLLATHCMSPTGQFETFIVRTTSNIEQEGAACSTCLFKILF